MTTFLLASMISLSSLTGTTFYVAKDGKDTWTGRPEAASATRSDGPFASIERARDAIRGLKAAGGLKEPVTVLVRGGVYALDKTLMFTAEDSGTKEFPITYRAFPGETVVLTGNGPVRGWKEYRGKICVAKLAEQYVRLSSLTQGTGQAGKPDVLDDFRFRELFFQDQRQVLARYPNLDPAHPVTGGLLYVDETASSNKNSFHYKQGSIPLDTWRELSQAEVNIFPYNCWDHNILRVAKVDTEASLIALRHNVAGSIFVGNRYFIQNVFEALDAPGEWFCDYATGKLYFYPPTGKLPGDGDVVVPVLENLVEFSGTPERPVEHIRFHGFTLKHARQDAVALEGAHDCQIIGNTITQVGGVGVNAGYLRNGTKGVGLPWRKPGVETVHVHSGDRALQFSHPCRQCRIAGNDIASIGGDGIVLGGTKNVADNNHIFGTGIYDRVCAALTICGDENVASHNAIHDVPRDGIFINGKLNVAEYNEIRNSMLYTADNAAIALRQHDVNQAVKNRGNVLRYNRILDCVGYGSYPHCTHPGDGFASPYCSFGIYLDASISGVTVQGNVIARCGGNSLFIQFGGGNVVENNIFVEGDAKRTQFDSMIFFGTFMFSDFQHQYREPPNQIRHNIFCYGGPETKLYKVGHWDNAPAWNAAQAVFEDNLIWRRGLPIEVWMHRTLDCRTLAEWQARGHDTRSLTADPLFMDATKDDYRLKPESPAYRIGFSKTINAEIDKIGVYRSDDRATWPLANAVLPREQPVVFEFSKDPVPVIDGFELTPVGTSPGKFQVSAEGPASALVSDDAAKDGRHSLKFVDAPGLKRPWEPHLYCQTNYRRGKIHFSVDLMNAQEAPADLYMELRDWEKDLFVGPTFRVTRDGKFLAGGLMGAGGTLLADVPIGQWYNVSIDFELGDGAPREYTLRLCIPGKEDVVATRPFGHDGFRNATWFGISSTSTDRAVFHVDNLVLGPAGSEKVINAKAAPSIKGRSTPRPNAQPIPLGPDRLAGFWKFDDNGYELGDTSANTLHGNLGNAAWAKGAFGKAIYLDGSGGAAVIPDSPVLQFGTGDFTIECWLHPLTLDIASEHKRRRVIEKGGYPGTWWNIDLQSDGKVMMEMADQGSTSGTTVSAGSIAEKRWTHLAVTVDRTNLKTRYYLDGKLDSSRDIPKSFTGRLDVSGKPLSTGTWQPYVGLIDELKIYRRMLQDAEIAAGYETAKNRYASREFSVIPDD